MRDFDDVLNRVSIAMTPKLRQAAIDGGWPEDVAKNLKVVSKEGLLTPTYSGDWKEVEDLEFGTEKDPPLPVFNNFFNNHAVTKDIGYETRQSMHRILRNIRRIMS